MPDDGRGQRSACSPRPPVRRQEQQITGKSGSTVSGTSCGEFRETLITVAKRASLAWEFRAHFSVLVEKRQCCCHQGTAQAVRAVRYRWLKAHESWDIFGSIHRCNFSSTQIQSSPGLQTGIQMYVHQIRLVQDRANLSQWTSRMSDMALVDAMNDHGPCHISLDENITLHSVDVIPTAWPGDANPLSQEPMEYA